MTSVSRRPPPRSRSLGDDDGLTKLGVIAHFVHLPHSLMTDGPTNLGVITTSLTTLHSLMADGCSVCHGALATGEFTTRTPWAGSNVRNTVRSVRSVLMTNSGTRKIRTVIATPSPPQQTRRTGSALCGCTSTYVRGDWKGSLGLGVFF